MLSRHRGYYNFVLPFDDANILPGMKGVENGMAALLEMIASVVSRYDRHGLVNVLSDQVIEMIFVKMTEDCR